MAAPQPRDPHDQEALYAATWKWAGIVLAVLVVLIVLGSFMPAGMQRTVDNTNPSSSPPATQSTPPTKTQ